MEKVYIQDLEQLLENEIDDPMKLGAYRYSVDELNKSFTAVFELPNGRCIHMVLPGLRRIPCLSPATKAYAILKQLDWTWWIEG
jgi:hypothetical protein